MNKYGENRYMKNKCRTSVKTFFVENIFITKIHWKIKLTSEIIEGFIPCIGHCKMKLIVNEGDILKMMDFMTDDMIVELQQTVGIPMDTNCASLLADVFFVLV